MDPPSLSPLLSVLMMGFAEETYSYTGYCYMCICCHFYCGSLGFHSLKLKLLWSGNGLMATDSRVNPLFWINLYALQVQIQDCSFS